MSAARTAPQPGAIFREHLRMIGESLRWEIAALLALLIGFVIAHGIAYRVYGGSIDAEIALVGVFGHWMGFLVAIGVWKGHPPSRRGYFWSMPVERPRLTLSLASAGLLWMAGLVVAVISAYIVLSMVAGGSIMMGPTMPIDGHYWIWLLPFVTATFGYLLWSAVMIGTDRPWLTLLGLWALWLLVFGLTGISVPARDVVVDTLMLGDFGYYKFVQGMEMQPGVRWQPDPGGWLVSIVIWMTPVALLFWAAVRRRVER